MILENEAEKDQSLPCESVSKFISMQIQYKILGGKKSLHVDVLYTVQSGFKTDVVG